MIIDLLAWFALALALVGVFKNAQRKISGFYYFIVSNSLWVGIFIYQGRYVLVLLFFIYLIMSFYGLSSWRLKERGDKNP